MRAASAALRGRLPLLLLLLAPVGRAGAGDGPDLAAAGEEEDVVVFASSDELFLCLGLAPQLAPEKQEPLALALVDCTDPSARWWRNLTSALLWDSLQAASSGACLAPGETASEVPRASPDACAGGHLWRFRGTQLQLLGNASADAASDGGGAAAAAGSSCGAGNLSEKCRNASAAGPPRRCLERQGRGVGAKVLLARCVDPAHARRQLWVPLPRGAGDPNARLLEVQPPLRFSGRHLYDAQGRLVRLRGVNWYGAHMEQKVNNGLDKQPISRIPKLIKHLGFNHVRLNYAVEMWVRRNTAGPVRPEFVSANPQLQGKSPIEVFDAVVEALTSEGLLVIINSHMSDHRWCCSLYDENGLWYNDRWSEQAWLDSLTGMAKRYADNPRVIGFDPRNEPRPVMPRGSNRPIAAWWDTSVWGNCTQVSLYSNGEPLVTLGSYSQKGICLPQFAADWRKAATQGAYAIWHGNPEALVFVEGLFAADAQMAQRNPMPFEQDCLLQKVVWSVHDYNWAWRWNRLLDFMNNGASNPADVFQTLSGLYQGANNNDNSAGLETFVRDRERSWAFLLKENVSPVWVGEFGEDRRSLWWQKFIAYAKEMDLDWCYWALDAYKYQPGNVVDPAYMMEEQAWGLPTGGQPITHYIPDDYGLLGFDYASAKHTWKLVDLVYLQKPVLEDPMEGPISSGNETCIFDAALQPVVPSDSHPTGLAGFLDTAPTTCDAGQAPPSRRLSAEVDMLTASRDETPPSGELAQLGDDPHARTLAKLAWVRRSRACSGVRVQLGQPRNEARRIVAANQVPGPNPIDAVLRSGSPEEAHQGLQRLLQAQMGDFQAFLKSQAIALPLTLVGVCILASFSPRVKRSGWRTPSESLHWLAGLLLCCCRAQRCSSSNSGGSGSGGACSCGATTSSSSGETSDGSGGSACSACLAGGVGGCRAAAWAPPAGVSNATAAAKSWRPWLAVSYVALAAGIIGVAVWGLSGSVVVQRGVKVAQCATLRGVDEALNGDSRGFLGLLPALAHIGNLTQALATDSPDWGNIEALVTNMQEVPQSVQELRELLDLVSGIHASDGADTVRARAVKAKVDWSWARALEWLGHEVADLQPKALKALRGIRGQVADARERVQDLRDFVVSQVTLFYDNDPLAWASSMVQMALVALMVTFFVVVIPTLLFSTIAVLLFVLPPDSCRCCRTRIPTMQKMLSRSKTLGALQERDTWMRPHAAFIVWTSGALFSVVLLGTSAWLHTSTAVSASACTVLDNLTNTTLLEYSAALGLPTANHTSIIQRAAASVITECFGKPPADSATAHAAGGHGLGNVIEVRTCPANALPATVREVFDNVRNVVTRAFEQAEDQAERDALSTDDDLVALTATLGNLTARQLSAEERIQLEVAAAGMCQGSLAEACANISLRLAPQADPTRTAGAQLAMALQYRASAVDAAVMNVTRILRGSLVDKLQSRILNHVVALTESLDCQFLRKALSDAADGLCFQLVVGLIQLRNALFTLGLFCMAMSVMMYFLWLRLAQHRALVTMYHEGAKQARSGGTAVNFSAVSRRLAMEGKKEPLPQLPHAADIVNVVNEDLDTSASPMERGSITYATEGVDPLEPPVDAVRHS